MSKQKKTSAYTCNEYREEMILLGLQKRLAMKELSDKERDDLLKEIARVEQLMGID